MTKKILITLALVIPTIILSTILFTNTEKIGVKKEMVDKTYKIDGMTCQNCEQKVRRSFSGTKVTIVDVSFEKERATFRYDSAQINKEWLNEQLQKNELSIVPSNSLTLDDLRAPLP